MREIAEVWCNYEINLEQKKTLQELILLNGESENECVLRLLPQSE